MGLVNDLGFIGLPGFFASLFSMIGFILGLPRLRTAGVDEDVSSPLFEDVDLGFLPGFLFTAFTRDDLYFSRW